MIRAEMKLIECGRQLRKSWDLLRHAEAVRNFIY
jgi:hypothetical protein